MRPLLLFQRRMNHQSKKRSKQNLLNPQLLWLPLLLQLLLLYSHLQLLLIYSRWKNQPHQQLPLSHQLLRFQGQQKTGQLSVTIFHPIRHLQTLHLRLHLHRVLDLFLLIFHSLLLPQHPFQTLSQLPQQIFLVLVTIHR